MKPSIPPHNQNKTTLTKSVLPLPIIYTSLTSMVLAMSLTACDMQEMRERQLEKQKQVESQNIISEVDSKLIEQDQKQEEKTAIKIIEAKVDPSDSTKATHATPPPTKASENKDKLTETSGETPKAKIKTDIETNSTKKPEVAKPLDSKKVDEKELSSTLNKTVTKPTEQLRTENTVLPDTVLTDTTSINKPVTVSVIDAKLVTVPHVKTFSGTTTAFETLQVQPNGDGTVSEIYFKQGNWIKAGAPLYRITPTKNSKNSLKTIKASHKQAKASLASAQAGYKHAKALLKTHESLLVHAQDDLNRYEKLIADKIVSEQTYQQAVNEVKTAKSAIKSTKALISQTSSDIKTAKANIELTNSYLRDEKAKLEEKIVKAPLTGVVTDSHIVKGKKVSRKQTNSFVTIATVNPIFVNIHPSSDEMLTLKKGFIQKKIKGHINKAKLLLDNGNSYASSGAFKFTETKVNENNQITMKVLFDNPKGQLLPNMKVAVQLPMPKMVDVVLVPPTAIQNSIVVNIDKPNHSKAIINDTKTVTVDKVNKVAKNTKPIPQVTYTIKPGDSLDKIANKNAVSVSDIVTFNNLDNPNDIKAGQVLSLTQSETNNKQAKKDNTQVKADSKADKKVNELSKNTDKTPISDAKNKIAKQNSSKQTVANFVYVVDKDERVQTRNVTINPDNDYHGKLIIEKGLKQGDKVIIDSEGIILPRQLVAIKGAETTQTATDKTTAHKETTDKKISLKLYPWQFLTDD